MVCRTEEVVVELALVGEVLMVSKCFAALSQTRVKYGAECASEMWE
jgi:hypothetical protein